MSEEVIHESWFSRLGGAIKGILLGVALFVAAFPVLWCNEGRSVKTAKALKEGAAAVQEATIDRIDPTHDGKFVHLTGPATTDDVLKDPEFGIAVNAIRLERKVEMFQWQERTDSKTRKKLGGGTKTTNRYSYHTDWADRAIDSSRFHDSGYDNPPSLPFEQYNVIADDVRLGAYQLPSSLVEQIGGAAPLPVKLDDLPESWQSRLQLVGNHGLYLAKDGTRKVPQAAGQVVPSQTPAGTMPPSTSPPQVGDVRISFYATLPTDVSVMSCQQDNTFAPYETRNGHKLHMIALGNVLATDMIAKAESENRLWTWGLRVVGFLMMGFGLSLVMKPLAVLADVLPIVGSFVEFGTGLVSFGIAAACSLATVSLAWLFYRPMLGVPLLLAAIGVLVLLARLVLKSRSGRSVAPAADSSAIGVAGTDTDPAPEAIDEAISV